MAHFNYELKVAEILVKISGISSLLFQNFNLLLNLIQVFIDSIYLFVPLERVDLCLKDLMVLPLFFIIVLPFLGVRIKEIDFGFFCFSLNHIPFPLSTDVLPRSVL